MSLLRFVFFFAICCFANVGIGTSQESPRVKFDHPLADFTLPSESIITLFQDSEDFIWMGTTVGLVRYNGQNIDVYQHIPGDDSSLSSRSVNWVAEHDGDVWITTDNGLNRYNPATNAFDQFLTSQADSVHICGEFATTITPKDEDTFWLGSLNGLCEFNTRTLKAKLVFAHNPNDTASLSHSHVLAIERDQNNHLWVGTTGGLHFIDTKTQAVRRISLGEAHETPLPVFTIQLQNDVAWVGTWGGGVKQVNANSFGLLNTSQQPGLQSIKNADVIQILIDENEHVWIASYGDGLCRLEANNGAFNCMYHESRNPYSLSDNKASALLQDRENNLWVGTWAGLDKIGLDHGFETIKINKGNVFTPEPAVHAIYELDENRLLIGTPDSPLLLGERSGETQEFDFTPLRLQGHVRAIAVHNNVAWLATSGQGLQLLDLDTMTIIPWRKDRNPERLNSIGRYIYDVLIDQNKGLWASTNGTGVFYMSDYEKPPIRQFNANQHKDSLSHHTAWPLFQDENGDIWIGTLGGGLNKFDPATATFTSFKFQPDNPTSISSNDVTDITADKSGYLWISTQMGINRMNLSTMEFQNWTEAEGLTNNQAYCALVDEMERVWISTRDGLSVLEPDTNQITRFYAENQLPSNHFTPSACHKGASGRFYFGTETGILTFWPERINLDVADDILAKITRIAVNGETQPLHRDLDLAFNQNSVVLEVTAPSYAIPERNEIFYRLNNGIDTTWINLEGSVIRFANLSPGDYNLELKARNSYGRYSQTTVTKSIRINVPYWQTSWFRLLVTLLVCLIGYAIYQVRLRYALGLARRSHEAQLRIEKLRNDLAADYHDGVGGSLGSLSIEMGLLASHQALPAELKSKLQKLLAKLKRISELRREMSWIIDAKNDLFSSLLDRIRQVAFDIVPNEKLELDIPEAFRDRAISMETRRQCLFFVKEALQNAVKHANASEICVRITLDDTRTTFSIIDNGIGFNPDMVEHGEGLHNLKQRADALNGTLHIASNQPAGTVVRLTVIMDDSSHPPD